MRESKKRNLILLVILVLFSIGIGYAYLNTTLSIEGTTDIDSASWNVYFDNVQIVDGSVSGDQVTSAPIIDTGKTKVTYHVRLKNPGDYYEFLVDVRNDGTIDAMIDTVLSTINGGSGEVPNYLDYHVEYDDYIDINEGDLLKAGEIETYRVSVKYRTDINASDLPDAASSLNLSFSVTYVQADDSVVDWRDEMSIYAATNEYLFANREIIPEGVTFFDTYQEAMTSFDNIFFTKYTVADGIVTRTYVGYVFNNRVYYLRGSNGKYSYKTNKDVLNESVGETNCTETTEGEEKYYNCSYEYSGYTYDLSVDNKGNVMIMDGSDACHVHGVENFSHCGYHIE